MTTVLDLLADAAPTADDQIYVVNDPAGTPGNRRVTLQDLATALAGMAGLTYVATTGAQSVAGVKTFTSAPVIPDEVYGVAWNGKLEPPTKNAVYDAISGLPPLDTTTPAALSIYPSGGFLFVDFIGAAGSVFSDAAFTVQDNIDPTKQVMLQLAGLTPATLRTLTVPDLSGTLALTTGAQTLTNKTLSRNTLLSVSETILAGPVFGALTSIATDTLDFASAFRLATFLDSGTTVFNQGALAGATSDSVFSAGHTVRNASGVALALGNLRPFVDGQAIIADAAAVTASGYQSFRAAAALSIVGGGTLALTNLNAFAVALSVGAGITVTTMNVHGSTPSVPGGLVTTLSHYKANNVTPSGGGAITNLYGANVDQQTGGTTISLGLRMAGGVQFEPTARSIAVVGDALTAGAVYAPAYDLTNTSGGSLTLTSAPTLPDGMANGQEVVFLNVGAQNIVLQDQGTLPASNLRLSAATISLGPRDSIRLRWSTGIGDWVQQGQANVL